MIEFAMSFFLICCGLSLLALGIHLGWESWQKEKRWSGK